MALVELNIKAKPVNKYAHIMGDGMAMYIEDLTLVGSQYCVNPPPKDSATDYLCLLTNKSAVRFDGEAKQDGWKEDGAGKGYDHDSFFSYRKGNINLIVMWDSFLFYQFQLAANLCKALNLKDKQHRIMVHNAIMHNQLEKKPKQQKGLLGEKEYHKFFNVAPGAMAAAPAVAGNWIDAIVIDDMWAPDQAPE